MRRVAIGLSAAVAIGLVACSSDDDDTAGPASSTAATTVAATTDAVTTTATDPTATATATATDAPDATPPVTDGDPSTTFPSPTGEDPRVTLTEIDNQMNAIHLAWRPGDDAIYAVQQFGLVQRIDDGGATAVLDVEGAISATGEQGLLGLAFDATGDLAYVSFTDPEGAVVIEERAVADDGTFADDARRLLRIEKDYGNHNGGTLMFGPDGYLYFGMGDGGGDGTRRSPDLSLLYGKLLRIDPRPAGAEPYTIPPDNPYVDEPGARPEIWSSGLRNPWRYSFDRETGDLWIGDVGEVAVEEIDVAPATAGVDAGKGLYFGWGAFEGDQPFRDGIPTEGAWPPITTYGRDQGCAVIGGVRARGPQIPDLVGWYVYGDTCTGQIWALEVLGDGLDMTAGRQISLGETVSLTAILEAPDGTLYTTSHLGPISRIDAA